MKKLNLPLFEFKINGAARRMTARIGSLTEPIRQILGWWEYVRGIYWLKMPDYKCAFSSTFCTSAFLLSRILIGLVNNRRWLSSSND